MGLGLDLGRTLLDLKIEAAIVDVGRQHIDAHAPAFVDKVDDLVGLVAFDQQQRRHIFDGIVGLQIGRLHGDDRIVGGMALVEAIARKELDILVDFGGGLFWDVVGAQPSMKIFL